MQKVVGSNPISRSRGARFGGSFWYRGVGPERRKSQVWSQLSWRSHARPHVPSVPNPAARPATARRCSSWRVGAPTDQGVWRPARSAEPASLLPLPRAATSRDPPGSPAPARPHHGPLGARPGRRASRGALEPWCRGAGLLHGHTARRPYSSPASASGDDVATTDAAATGARASQTVPPAPGAAPTAEQQARAEAAEPAAAVGSARRRARAQRRRAPRCESGRARPTR